ncbi:hypothetical protein [Parabacteroides pacaensis]|uniref:hypothetical protein n=1 Tax=Parabacteroides pacaensis TaxID=2086575 RepID=UPI000D0F9BCF|nr:hypothetical protein [Parabacteroides pacaensis]
MKKLKSYLNLDIVNITTLVLLTIVAYYPTFSNDFIYLWDDQWQVITKTTENGFNWDNLVLIFTEPFYNQFFPVNQFLYMCVYILSNGYHAPAFHIFCLFFHILNVLMAYLLLKKALYLSGRMNENDIKPITFLTALLFAIHPLNVESVAWISASKILVYSFFYLLALYIYIIYCEKNHTKYLLLSLCMLIISCLGKEQAIILPFCLLIFDWLLNRNLYNKKIWIEKIPFLLISFGMGCLTLYLAYGNIKFSSENYTIFERIIFSSYAYLEYIFKYLFPINLLYLYPFPSLPGQMMPLWIYPYPLIVLAILFCFWKLFQKYWQITFGLLFFTVNLLMVLHLIPLPRFVIVADRYIYLSSIGLSFIFSYLVFQIIHLPEKYHKVIYSIVVIFFIYWGCYTNIRVRVWHDSESLKGKIQNLINQRNDINPKERSKTIINSD